MARTGMAPLIQHVRQMTGAGTAEYQVGAVSHFTDDQVQDALDRRRGELWQRELMPEPRWVMAGEYGTLENTRYRLPLAPVESGTAAFQLHDSRGSVHPEASYTLDPLTGIVEFATDQGTRNVYCRAVAFDMNAAAADILEEWAGALAVHSWGVTQDQQVLDRRERHQSMLEAARQLRKRAWARRVRIRREDG